MCQCQFVVHFYFNPFAPRLVTGMLLVLVGGSVALKLLATVVTVVAGCRTLVGSSGLGVVTWQMLVASRTGHGQLGGRGLVNVLVAATPLAATRSSVAGGAAADSEQPEEAGGDGEGGGKPYGRQEVGVQGSGHTISFGCALNRCHDDGTDDGCHCCGGYDCDGGKQTNDGCTARKRTAAVGEEAQDDLKGQCNEGDDEDDLGPTGHGAKGVHSRLDGVRDGDVLAHGRGNTVDHGLEVAGGVGGPVVAGLLASLGAIRRYLTVVPQADNVGIRKA